jgi:hypothetical protein
MSALRNGPRLGLAALVTACTPASFNAAAGEPALVVRYEHVRTCTGFLGREGQFFVYRVLGIDNSGAAPFTLQPSLLRFPPGTSGGSAPVLAVPEFSDVEVAPASRQETTEIYLLERGAPGPPPRGRVLLAYDEPGVRMDPEATEPRYAGPRGCDDLNT